MRTPTSKSTARNNTQDVAKKRMTPTEREKARIRAEQDEKEAKLQATLNSRRERASRRVGRMEGIEVGPQQPLEPVPQARETTPLTNTADEARRMEAALQEQIARDNAAWNERDASTGPGSEMDYDVEIDAQFEAEMAAANERAQEAERYSPDDDDHEIQAELARQYQAETASSDAAQAPTRPDNLLLQELEAQNRALSKAAEMANQERLDAVSARMAETIRADDATAANQQLAKLLNHANFERDSTVQLTQDLKARNAELLVRQSELERQAETMVAMGKANTEAANRAQQEAEARANRLEAASRVLRGEREDAVHSVGERDQQLAQARARNEALTKSQTEAKQAADLRLTDLEQRYVELVEAATQADVSVTAEKANREVAERELAKRDSELRASKESLTAERAARLQADTKAADLDGKLKTANEAAAGEKAGREAAEREAASQQKLVNELSGEGDKAKALETARRDAEAKASDLERKLQSANELAAREKAGREIAEASSKAATGEADHERAALEAAYKNAQELKTQNGQLATQVREATQARVQMEERMKTMSDRENPEVASELRKQLEQEKAAHQATDAKLTATTVRMIDQSKAAASARLNGTQQAARDAERITRLEAELKAARETPDPDKPIPSIEKDKTGKNISRIATAAKDDEFGVDDIDDADFDAAVAAAEAKQKEAAAAKAKDDEFGMDDISDADFDAVVAAAEARQKEAAASKAKDDEFGMDDISDADFDAAVAAAEAKEKQTATAAKLARAALTGPAPASRKGSPALDPAHTDKGNAWYRAGKMYVPDAQYEKMLKAGVKVDREVKNGQTKRVPLEADKSAREILLQTPNGDLHSLKVYRNVHGAAAFEARAKAEGFDPKTAIKWATKDRTRPEILVKTKNGNLVDGSSLEIAAGSAGLAGKFGKMNVFIQNQNTKINDGHEIKTGTGNYRRADNAIEHARATGGTITLNQRLDTMRVNPQPEGRNPRSSSLASNLSSSRTVSPSKRGKTPERVASPTPDRRPVYRNGQVVASVPVNGNKTGVKRLNNSQRAESAQPRQNNQGDNRNYRGGSQLPATGYQRPNQGGAHNRDASPTTTINLTVNGAVGHGTAAPNVGANAASQTKYSPKLDDRPQTRDPLVRS